MFLLLNQMWSGMTRKRLKAGAVPLSSTSMNCPPKPSVQVDISYRNLTEIFNKFIDNAH